MIISDGELQSFLSARHATPHDRLGMHQVVADKKIIGIVARAYLQDALHCSVEDVSTGDLLPMERLDDSGFFETFIETRSKVFQYRFVIIGNNGDVRYQYDPYSFLPTVSAYDCYLFGQGKHHEVYKKLGSHVCKINGVDGASFAVWAPNAQRISVVGDFNHWDGRYHPMRLLRTSGIWEIFIPNIRCGEKYKYEILDANGALRLKSDPYANYFECPTNNASIVYDIAGYRWNDDDWIKSREKKDWQRLPLSIYEVHLDSWMRIPEDGGCTLSYIELGERLARYVNDMGFSHVEIMPPTEYPYLGSWGYQVTGFYAPTHRYGTPSDFMRFVDIMHNHDIGVIIDWVPGHFPKDEFSLSCFDGTKLYEHNDPRQGEHAEWGTLIFNYGRHEVRNFLLGSVLNWIKNFHIDGIRVDAVASMLYLDYDRKDGEWIPNQYGGKENIEALSFLRELNDVVHQKCHGVITIAEESTAFSGITRSTKYDGVGFDFKWNMGWMHDTLNYFSLDPIYRKHHHNQLTFAMIYQYSEHFISAISHDEVVYGKRSMLYKMPGATIAEKARHLMALYSYMWLWPGKKTLFMGCEFGQSDEWKYYQSLDWHLLQYDDHRHLRQLIKDLNSLYKGYVFLSQYDMDPAGFEWLSCDDCENSVIAFLRKSSSVKDDKKMLVICNFTPVERHNYRIGVPDLCCWKEIFNSDAAIYGGLNRGNSGGCLADELSSHCRPYSLSLYLPPLSVLCLMPDNRLS